ncbi:hypothetical protein AX15_004797 [Amanita polypyramis BW_CC]|nr:hypothetical protein AX15_004797 [Amanita polypyramis BW_CC]
MQLLQLATPVTQSPSTFAGSSKLDECLNRLTLCSDVPYGRHSIPLPDVHKLEVDGGIPIFLENDDHPDVVFSASGVDMQAAVTSPFVGLRNIDDTDTQAATMSPLVGLINIGLPLGSLSCLGLYIEFGAYTSPPLLH